MITESQERWKTSIYIFFIGLMMFALPWSKFLMSLSQFFLASWFLLAPVKILPTLTLTEVLKNVPYNFLHRFKRYFSNKNALIFSSIFLLHLAGLLFTSDYTYALKDLRTKFPLFLIPLYLTTGPVITRKHFNILIAFFGLGLLTASVEALTIYFSPQYISPRSLSPHISHIRLSLNILTGIFFISFIALHHVSGYKRLLTFFISIWLILFLLFLQAATGWLILIILSIILFFHYLTQKWALWLRYSFIILLITATSFAFNLLYHNAINWLTTEPINISKLDQYTADGNRYTHDTTHYSIENGQYVGLYLSFTELKTAWNKRSTIPFDYTDKYGQNIKNALIRFLNSKNLRKDARGIAALTDEEVKYIEQGYASVNYIDNIGFKRRYYQILKGIQNYREANNPNASSLMQRAEYWKAAIGIIKKHPLTGVGTGDVNNAFSSYYNRNNSNLEKQYQRRSHNQYLSVMVAFGIPGLIWFLFALLYPAWPFLKKFDYHAIIILAIIMLSMLNEDTMETQAGITFITMFYSLIILSRTIPHTKSTLSVDNNSTPPSPE